jgi:hypothetical protein
MALEDQNQMENVGGRGDVPSCHKVNVFMSRETPAGSPSVVYVVKGAGPAARTATRWASCLLP